MAKNKMKGSMGKLAKLDAPTKDMAGKMPANMMKKGAKKSAKKGRG